MKPYYQDDSCTIYLGDCREILPTLEKVDLVLTDPPYGMGKAIANDEEKTADILAEWAASASRNICDGNVLFFWSAQRWEKIDPLFKPKRVMIWDKDWAIYTPNNVGYRYELIVWISGKQATTKRGDIFKQFPIIREVQIESAGHPTQKPLKLIEEIVRDFSEGGTILDPFMGSGTTLVAAKNLGRKAIGIEIEEKYCEIAVKRLRQEVMNLEEKTT
jgi:site-specific DNA-methyltransferase (adenine-specific)